MAGNGQKLTGLRQRLFKMVSVGVVDDRINQGYDVISTGLLLLNLIGAFAGTFDDYAAKYGVLLHHIESVTVAFFALDYVLRMYTAPCLYPDEHGARPYMRYALSGAGIIDLMSFLPYYLPMFFPAGAVAFRLIRVARILRLFRINAYYDSMNVITDVIVGKSQQLLSSVFIIFVLMLASSLAMYSIEHEAQPDVFKNAFSGIWWSVSTLLTVGYGDIYPITPLGKAFGILITFLGVGMVAIPTGIISAGFVEQYSRLQRISDYAKEENLHFVKIELSSADDWNGKQIMDLHLPHGMIVAVIQRGRDIIVPRENRRQADPRRGSAQGRSPGQPEGDHAAEAPRLERHGHQGPGHLQTDLHRDGAARRRGHCPEREPGAAAGGRGDPLYQGASGKRRAAERVRRFEHAQQLLI